MLRWSIEKKVLPLKVDWSISRNTSSFKENYFISVSDGTHTGMGEVAFNIRYGESKELVESGFAQFLEASASDITNAHDLMRSLDQVDIINSLRFGIESAFLHFLKSNFNKPIHDIIGTKAIQMVRTSYSIPILPIDKLDSFYKDFNLSRFDSIKIKINAEDAVERVKKIASLHNGPLKIDANEAFLSVDDVMKFAEGLQGLNIQFLEQPLPHAQFDDYIELKKHLSLPLIADESITNNDILIYHKQRFDGVNIKLMKSGGYLRAIHQIKQAKDLGLKVMIGCMIESSLGIHSAINICHGADYFDLDGFLFLEKDPFHLVQEEGGRVFKTNLS